MVNEIVMLTHPNSMEYPQYKFSDDELKIRRSLLAFEAKKNKEKSKKQKDMNNIEKPEKKGESDADSEMKESEDKGNEEEDSGMEEENEEYEIDNSRDTQGSVESASPINEIRLNYWSSKWGKGNLFYIISSGYVTNV